MRFRIIALATTIVALLALPASAQAVPDRFYGVVAQGLFTDEEYDLMAEAGVGTLRLQMSWTNVQPAEGRCQAAAQLGVCDWRFYDFLIGDAAARGIEFFPYLLNVPPYISKHAEEPPVRSKEAREGWTGFVEAAAKRFGPGGAFWDTAYPIDHPGAAPVPIQHWQVWNEPSAAPFWHPKPKPREYAKLVKITSKALTEADPDAYVVLAGLFGTPTVGIDQPKFIRALYRTPGVERYFDAVAIHPYGPDLERVKLQVEWARDEMKRAGDGNADVWISEIGWASDRVHNQLGVGRKGQAKMVTKAFELFRDKRTKWNIKSVNWYAWQDSDLPNLCDFCRRSGLVDVNQQPKLSYEAFAAEATR